jgi:Na+/H+ antiporter NhaD/arsenite permease-like protein
MTRTSLTSIAPLVVAPATAHAASLDGAALTWPWALPFIGILATIAIAPLRAPKIWRRHYGKLAFIWATLAVVPLAALYDLPTARAAFLHMMLGDYMSFIVLLLALYVVAGGILVTGNLRGTPLVNTALLALGAAIASLVGTTGAAMILIRPLLRANAARLHNAHVVVFFIFLAANIGGSLTPLGNPPLFVGFLHGVDFFWTAQHLAAPTAVAAALVLAASSSWTSGSTGMIAKSRWSAKCSRRRGCGCAAASTSC